MTSFSNGTLDVAPLAGAWIETGVVAGVGVVSSVAPIMGAWIETHSPLLAVEGPGVAPLAGAWMGTNRRQRCHVLGRLAFGSLRCVGASSDPRRALLPAVYRPVFLFDGVWKRPLCFICASEFAQSVFRFPPIGRQ